ncbi:MAG: relaxase/mobilization nuclease domain-containing protein [Alphaproteobacteria bacterium]|nr:relaxase/mobilization nuclease domain-containing protein [Alphaproteobacteria bacterium]
MILKGNQRGGGRQMAAHLLNGMQNEHVTIHQVRGFLASTVRGALEEAYALAQGTQCKQYLYSLSLNPPKDQNVPVEVFEAALKTIEEKLGLQNQPRVVVFHEKEGRRHAHCVWSRIDVNEMKAVNIAFDRRKLQAVSRQLFIEHGWTMPKGLIDPAHRNPLTYTRAEWQQAARTGRSASAIKSCLQECWAASDARNSFESALHERGFLLAQGDRRGFVAVDVYGEVLSLTRQLGLKTKQLEKRLGKPQDLPSVAEAKEKIGAAVRGLFEKYRAELQKTHEQELRPLLRIKTTMTEQHRKDRAAQKAYQEKRWNEEQNIRASRIRKGFKGLWDKLTFKYWTIRKANEKEAWHCHVRDREERQELIETQLGRREKLQTTFMEMRTRHEKEMQVLAGDLAKMAAPEAERAERSATPEAFRGKAKETDLGIGPADRTRPPRQRPSRGKGVGQEPDA